MKKAYLNHPQAARIQSVFFEIKQAGGCKTWTENYGFLVRDDIQDLIRAAGYKVTITPLKIYEESLLAPSSITIMTLEFAAKQLIKSKMIQEFKN